MAHLSLSLESIRGGAILGHTVFYCLNRGFEGDVIQPIYDDLVTGTYYGTRLFDRDAESGATRGGGGHKHAMPPPLTLSKNSFVIVRRP